MPFAFLRIFLVIFFLTGCGGGGGGGEGPVSGLDKRPSSSACQAFSKPTSNQIKLENAFPNLKFNSPVALLQAPGDNSRWFIVERGGSVITFDNIETISVSSVFIDISNRVVSGGERGLLGMAFHPNFENNGQVFLSYTGNGQSLISNISRFTSNDGGLTLSPASEEVIISVEQPYSNHNGGNIAFGPDGYLYIGFGDGGSGGDPDGNGQNINTLLGAILRIDVDSASPYAIPPDNPFSNSQNCSSGNGCPEIFAWGFRNPWRWSFDSETEELWVGDVGQNMFEEIDYVEINQNYGWNIFEGNHCYSAPSCDSTNLAFPVVEYSHDEGVSVTGGYVYRGNDIQSLKGKYIYGDYGTGIIWEITADPNTTDEPVLLINSGLNISSFAQDNDGELYVLDLPSGSIYRLILSTDTSTTDIPNKLSETGYFKAGSDWLPVSCFIPYDINAPFWSDGADKVRWLALPDNKFIHINSDEDWEFPSGSVLIKTFLIGGTKIETRLFVKHFDGSWVGYTYEWRDNETDADLVTEGKTKIIDGQAWIYPSSTECLVCHTSASGRSLGLETGQMNRNILYPSTGKTANQLSTFESIGMFDTPLTSNPANLITMPDPYEEGNSIESRAKSYLHTNCSQCHRPEGPTPSTMDFRYATLLGQMNICNFEPIGEKLGISEAKLLYLGDPDKSMVAVRMKLRGTYGMPSLGSNLVDSQGASLIDSWILNLSSCP